MRRLAVVVVDRAAELGEHALRVTKLVDVDVIYVDQVGLLSEDLMAKLLRVLEGRTVRRVGGLRDEPVNVWIIATTSEDLRSRVDSHRRYREAFNLHEPLVLETLYERLGQLNVLVPRLR
ncbi:MAG: sigma 54-interacting transcriptional regulator [Candidatus Rokuibacteriota bacterium]